MIESKDKTTKTNDWAKQDYMIQDLYAKINYIYILLINRKMNSIYNIIHEYEILKDKSDTIYSKSMHWKLQNIPERNYNDFHKQI